MAVAGGVHAAGSDPLARKGRKGVVELGAGETAVEATCRAIAPPPGPGRSGAASPCGSRVRRACY